MTRCKCGRCMFHKGEWWVAAAEGDGALAPVGDRRWKHCPYCAEPLSADGQREPEKKHLSDAIEQAVRELKRVFDAENDCRCNDDGMEHFRDD